jgi:hypothetical protein
MIDNQKYKNCIKKQLLFFVLLVGLVSCTGQAKKQWTLVVDAGNYDREDCVVSLDLSGLGIEDTSVALFELVGKKEYRTECQLDNSGVLYWVLKGKTASGTSRNYILKPEKKQDREKECMLVVDDGKALTLKNENANILQYNYTTVYPPEGVDSVYQRSGFIHPAYSPKGNVLTTIQPKDHYHHYGIWNPWTRVEYDGTIYDLWNLKDKQGTVRAKEIKMTYSGNVFAGYVASLDHYIFKGSDETVIMNEEWNVKAWNIPNGLMWDFESILNPSTGLPVLIKAYRYAGFGWRATQEWTKENCEMFTSEGKTRQEIDGTNARWIYVTGTCGANGRSGFLLMGYPENQNAPEPLRIWDENANGGRGDAFVNFAPTKNQDWLLEPGNKYTLRYRIFTYDGEMTKERADLLWNAFAYPPEVIVK